MIGPSRRISPSVARPCSSARRASRAASRPGDVQEVQLLDVAGQPPQLVGQAGEDLVADRGDVVHAAGGTARAGGSASRSRRPPSPTPSAAPRRAATSAPKNSSGRSVARIASTPVSDGLEILTRPLSTMCSASPGSPWWKITSPAPVATRPDGRGDPVEVLVAEVVEQRHPTERGPEGGRVRRLSRLAHAPNPTTGARASGGRRGSATAQEIDRTGVWADSRRGCSSAPRPVRRRASRASAAGPGSRWATAGTPASPPWRTVMSSGTLPRKSIPCCWANRSPPPRPKISSTRRSAGRRTRSCSRPRR